MARDDSRRARFIIKRVDTHRLARNTTPTTAVPPRIALFIARATRINEKLFRRAAPRFTVTICNTEEAFRAVTKNKTSGAMAAIAIKNKRFVMKNPRIFKFQKHAESIIIHEVNHLFWYDIVGAWKPVWLCEGLACFVSRGFAHEGTSLKRWIHSKKIILRTRYLQNDYRDGGYPYYIAWAAFTRYLIRQFGIRRILTFVNAYSKNPTQGHYARLFLNHFHKKDSELYTDFVKSLY